MRLTWFLTVFSARNRCAAISPLVCPPAISDMTSISRADRPRLVCSSTCVRLMRPPVKPVRDTQAPPRHDVKTYLYRYRYTKTAVLKPPKMEQVLSPAPFGVGPWRFQPSFVPVSSPAGTGLPACSASESWSACVRVHSTAAPALGGELALAIGTVPVSGPRSAKATWSRSYRLVPLSTETEPAAAEPNGSAVNGFRYTPGLVALDSRACRNARWSSIRCRSEVANECRSRTKAIACGPLRLWQPAARPLKPEYESAWIAVLTQIRTPPTELTTSARPPNPMPM